MPSNARKTLHMIFIGTNGTGKTTLVKKHFVEQSKRRVLIVDPDLLEPAWREYKKIDLSDTKAMRTFSGIRVAGCKTPDDLELIVDNYSNGALVLDDFGFYTDGNVPQSLRRLLIRRRQMVLDIFSITHGFTKVPPALITYMTHIAIFKTHDNPLRHRDKLLPEVFEAMMNTVRQVNSADSRHFYRILDMDALAQQSLMI